MPGLRVRFVDPDRTDQAAGADHVVGELGYSTKDIEVAYRAGAYREQQLATTTESDLTDVSTAKVAGARLLHHLALRRSGIRFVSSSSVNGFSGGSTVGGYTAANAYLDALAVRQRRSGISAHSIAWTMWDRVGMSAQVEHLEAPGPGDTVL
ncbi:KR domain-containing protein [Mycobacteroides abscessus]|uniref:KR domain-containing protein n=1 Tax=Mycobacteroides abscessus TaxID=36809 RepID=UPI001F3787E7